MLYHEEIPEIMILVVFAIIQCHIIFSVMGW